MNQLVIVESPHKAEAIEALYPSVRCVATVGQICDLSPTPMQGTGIHNESLQGQYVLTRNPNRSTDGVRLVAELQRHLAEHPGIRVTLATNPDAEGESTAAFLVKYLGLRDYHRVLPYTITKAALDKAWSTAGSINWAIANEHEARRIINRLVYSTAGPLLEQRPGRSPSSFLPLQAAVEALIVERERAIRNFAPKPNYTTRYDLGGWWALWEPPKPNPTSGGPNPNQAYAAEDLGPQCHNRAAAEHAASFRSLLVLDCAEHLQEIPPPPPLDTAAMIRTAFQQLGWGVGKTMQVAQQLFDGSRSSPGLITYYRSRNRSIAPEVAEAIRHRLTTERLPPSPTPSYASTLQNNGGIVPAHIELAQAGTSVDQQKLYRIIWERAMFSQLMPARATFKRIELIDPGRGTQRFAATGRAMLEPGWLATAAKQYAWDTPYGAALVQSEPAQTFPFLSGASIVSRKAWEVKEHLSSIPRHYTVDSLMSVLDRLGLAHPTLLPDIFRHLEHEGLINNHGTIQATDSAEKRYDALHPRFAFTHVSYAIELEQALKLVSQQQLDGTRLIRRVWDRLDSDSSS